MTRPTAQQRARDARIAFNLSHIRQQGGTLDDEREYLETIENIRVGSAPAAAAPPTTVAPRGAGSFASESTAAVRRGTSDTGGDVGAFNPAALARQGAQGLTFGFADEIEGGARALRSGRPYREERDKVRADTQAYADAHPLAAIGANVAGGLLPAIASGGAAGVARGGMGLASRLTRASALGGVAGAAAGAGNAKEVDEIVPEMARTAVLGAGLGAAGGAAGEAIGKAGRAAAGLIRPQANEVAGRFARVRAALANRADPERGGAQRVLRTIERSGRTLDDLDGAANVAPDPNALAEVVGPRGVGGLRMARNFGRRSDEIDAALAERASGEGGRFYGTVARETGLPAPRDADGVLDDAVGRITPRVQRLFRQAAKQPDVEAPEIAQVVQDLAGMGEQRVLKRARTLAVGRGTLAPTDEATTTVSVRNLQFLRRALDRRITELGKLPAPDQELIDLLGERRAVVDGVLKRAGGKAQQKADRLWAKAQSEGESFRAGTRIEQEMTEEGIARARAEARDPEAFRQGAASQALARIRAASDGEASNVRNPAALAVGDPVRRARFRAGFTDDDSFERARAAAREATERLRTKNTVSGGSQTARNLLEGGNEMADDPEMLADLARVMASPVAGSVNLATRALRAGGRAAFGDEMDAAGRLLGAGLPGEMTRAQALQRLREMEPVLRQFYAAQAARRGATAGALAGVGTRR
jgi:hypothetical protein